MCTFSAVINVWSSFEICIKMHRQIKCVFECLKRASAKRSASSDNIPL